MRPRRRRDALIVHELPDEVLVYDTKRDKAFCLGRNLAGIWRRCTGRRTPRQIAQALERELGSPVAEDVVGVALHRLGKARLLSGPVEAVPGARRTRRELLRRAAALGGLSILAVSAPTAGQAASCLPRGMCVNSHCTDPQGRVCCAGPSGCRQNSMVCGTGQSGFQCQ
jgi:hypothetical protein